MPVSVIKPPSPIPMYQPKERPWNPSLRPRVAVFGSIEMGKARDWQKELAIKLDLLGSNVILLNPRRDDWDSSWVQSIENPNFVEQVNWELDVGEQADLLAFYFDPDTRAPITFGELCMAAVRKPWASIVCCPEGYWRKGNVDIICDRHNMKQVASVNALAEEINRLEQVWRKS